MCENFDLKPCYCTNVAILVIYSVLRFHFRITTCCVVLTGCGEAARFSFPLSLISNDFFRLLPTRDSVQKRRHSTSDMKKITKEHETGCNRGREVAAQRNVPPPRLQAATVGVKVRRLLLVLGESTRYGVSARTASEKRGGCTTSSITDTPPALKTQGCRSVLSQW